MSEPKEGFIVSQELLCATCDAKTGSFSVHILKDGMVIKCVACNNLLWVLNGERLSYRLDNQPEDVRQKLSSIFDIEKDSN